MISVDAAVIAKLRSLGVRLIALRLRRLQQCRSLSRDETRHHSGARSGVSRLTPVAEHTIALMLALNRKLHRAL